MRFDHIYESWYEALSLSVEIANWIYLLTGESIRPISVLNISIFPIRYIFVQFLFFFLISLFSDTIMTIRRRLRMVLCNLHVKLESDVKFVNRRFSYWADTFTRF